MTRKATWVFAVIVAVAIFAPQAVLAAAGFSSTNGTPAVTGNNTMGGTNVAPGGKFTCKANGCRAIWAESFGAGGGSYGVYATSKSPTGRGLTGFNFATTGTAIGMGGQSNSTTGRGVNGLALASSGANYGGYFETKSGSGFATGVFGIASNANGTGTNFGVWGRNDGKGLNATGVYGFASATAGSPNTNGVWGRAPSANGAGLLGEGGLFGFYGAGGYAGGYGEGQTFGLGGSSPAIGNGTFGVLSYTDLGVVGHLMGSSGNIAGTADVVGTTPKPVTFTNPFQSAPIVILTPAGDPNPGTSSANKWWVEVAADGTGFTIKKTGSGTVKFNWIAIGLNNTMGTLNAPRMSRTGR